jgi:hypothetical protein
MKISELISEMNRRGFLKSLTGAGAAVVGANAVGGQWSPSLGQVVDDEPNDMKISQGDNSIPNRFQNPKVQLGNNTQLTRYRQGDTGPKNTRYTGVDQRITDKDTIGAGVGGVGKHNAMDLHVQHNFDPNTSLRSNTEINPNGADRRFSVNFKKTF